MKGPWLFALTMRAHFSIVLSLTKYGGELCGLARWLPLGGGNTSFSEWTLAYSSTAT